MLNYKFHFIQNFGEIFAGFLSFQVKMNVIFRLLGFIYTRAKATSLPTSYIVSNLCIDTASTAAATKIEGKNRFRVRFRSSISEPLLDDRKTKIKYKMPT